MLLDLERVRANVRQADTEDLLDRVTAYRADMEAEALTVIEEELRRRGVTASEMNEHDECRRREMLPPRPDGSVIPCSFCRRPAVQSRIGWHRLWGKVPVFPRQFYYCAAHQPRSAQTEEM